MNIKSSILLPVIFVLIGITTNAQKTVSDFRLKSTDNKWVSLKKYPAAKGFIIVFICNHCPFVSRYADRLNALNKKYAPLGVPLIAINSSDTLIFRDETFAKMTEYAKKKKYTFPYLCDKNQSAGRSFAANRTPHAFVIWKEKSSWVIEYSGSLDDNGAESSKITHAYISEAIENLLAGKKVTIPATNSIGCEIHYRSNPFSVF